MKKLSASEKLRQKKHYLAPIMDAMQPLEELGGPTGTVYLEVLREVEKEARQRRTAYAKKLRREDPRKRFRE